MIPQSVQPGLAYKVTFKYDYLGRRVEKNVFDWNTGTEEWDTTASETRRFVWAGWLLLLELDGSNNVVRKYTWRLDLSGTLSAAGGIGGLLAVRQELIDRDPDPDVPANDYLYCYDANGNVTQVLDWDAANVAGVLAAHYDYDPYGNVLNNTSSYAYAAENSIRFSTKYFDAETGLGYWGRRYYSPRLGRWLSRDPLGEAGGVNLAAFVDNEPLTAIDPFGLWGKDIHRDLTTELARMAGVCCPEVIGNAANRPDEDERQSGIPGAARVILYMNMCAQTGNCEQLVHELLRQSEWHFPRSPNGKVEPGSATARTKVEAAIDACDIQAFGEGLHVLQDSWSHQGIPTFAGLIGHARGAKHVVEWGWSWRWVTLYGDEYGARMIAVPFYGVTRNEWVPLTDEDALLSVSADDPEIWPADARASGLATYDAIRRFKIRCPCACPTKVTWHTYDFTFQSARVTVHKETVLTKTSCNAAADPVEVEVMLNKRYPGPNKVP